MYSKHPKHYLFNPQSEKSYNREYKPYKFKGVQEFQDERGYWYTMVGMKDYWDIDMVGRTSRERTGYPTQKPLKLLMRIINASSNKEDVVLDPFCGCATTCVAAEQLDRQWIGIDVSVKAYELVKDRLHKEITSSLFDWNKEITYSTNPPKRTGEDQSLSKKHVYVFSNPSYPGQYKVGIAKNWKSRLNSYQTADPKRGYKMEYYKFTPLYREIEAYIHKKYNANHEWVTAYLNDIIKDIKAY